jgi:hypothetical protein
MPVSQGIAAFGTLFKMGDGGSPTEAFATVAEVVDVAGPGGKTTMADLTSHTSPSGFKEKVPTTVDGGSFTLKVNFLPSAVTQGYTAGLLNKWLNRTKGNYQLLWPNVAGTYVTFAAYVTAFDMKAPVDSKLEATFTVEVTGAYTWTN